MKELPLLPALFMGLFPLQPSGLSLSPCHPPMSVSQTKTNLEPLSLSSFYLHLINRCSIVHWAGAMHHSDQNHGKGPELASCPCYTLAHILLWQLYLLHFALHPYILLLASCIHTIRVVKILEI
jgi:hypothetical protein